MKYSTQTKYENVGQIFNIRELKQMQLLKRSILTKPNSQR